MSELMDFNQIKEVIRILDEFRCRITGILKEMEQAINISTSFYDDPVMAAASNGLSGFIRRVSEKKEYIDVLIAKLEEEMMGCYVTPPKWD